MAELENQKLTDRILCGKRYYKLDSAWMLVDRYRNKFFIHTDSKCKINGTKFSAFTSDGQYVTVIETPREDYKRYFLAAGRLKKEKYKVTLEVDHRADITDYFYAYPDFYDVSVEAAYSKIYKCFCILNLSYYRIAFFWKLSKNPDDIIIKSLNKELNWIEDMSIEIKNGSLSIVDENQIQFVGTRMEYKPERRWMNVSIIYDFSLGAVVSVEDVGEPINKQRKSYK
jgi:hypothetical protein